MLDLSTKCNQYLKASGHTVYSLAKVSGLDRADIHHLMKGTHLPDRDFLEKFCDSLTINLSERNSIFELYEKAVNGPVAYHNRKYLSSILEQLSVLDSHPSMSCSSVPSYQFSLTEYTEFQGQTFIQVFYLLESLFCQTEECTVYCNFPITLPFSIVDMLQELHLRHPKHPPIHFHHILTFSANPSSQPDSSVNLEIVGHILPLAFSSFGSYHPCYIYSHSHRSDTYQLPWPHYMAAGEKALILSADGCRSILHQDTDYVLRYRQELQRLMDNARPLISLIHSPEQSLSLYQSPHDSAGYLAFQPCLIHCLCCKEANALPPSLTSIIHQLSTQNLARIFTDAPSFFTQEGVSHFWKTGEIKGQLASCLPPLSKEQ